MKALRGDRNRRSNGARGKSGLLVIPSIQGHSWRSRRGRSCFQLLGLALVAALGCLLLSPALAKAPPAGLPMAQPSPQTDAQTLVQQGKTLYEAGQFAKAAKVLQQAVQAYQTQADGLRQALTLSNLSLAQQQSGNWEAARTAIAQGLAVLDQIPSQAKGRTTVLAQLWDVQGQLQFASGQAQAALASWQKATEFYTQMGDRAAELRTRLNQAQALQLLGLYHRAQIALVQLKQDFSTEPDSIEKAVALRSLGDVQQLVGDGQQAQTTLQQSLQIARSLNSPEQISAALLSLGNAARAQQQTQAALAFYQQAGAIAPTPLAQGQTQLNQLTLLLERKQWAEAQALWTAIQPHLEALPLNRNAVDARINLAHSLVRLNCQTPRSTCPPSPQPVRSSLLTEAAQILKTAVQQARTLGDQRAESYALGGLGEVYEQSQQWSDAQTLTQQALLLAQTIEAPDIAYLWQWQLGRLLTAQGNVTGAIAAYKATVASLQALRNDLVATNRDVQFSFRDSVEPVYRQLVSLLLRSDEDKNKQETAVSQDNLLQARTAIESLQLAELEDFFRAACLTARSVEIDQIDRSAAVLYPIILPDRLEVVLSLPKQPLRHYTTMLPQETIEATLDQLRREIAPTVSSPDRGGLSITLAPGTEAPATPKVFPLTQKVYDWLLRPAEADLANSGVKTLVFVLDTPFVNVPMAALHDGQRYLIEQYSIALTPGLQLLASQPLTRGQLNVLLGGLSQARQGFPPLPNVDREVTEIKSQVPKSESLRNASFTSLKLKQEVSKAPFRVVHLATHGQFSSNIDDTFILTWDGKITVNDLSTLLQTKETAGAIELLVLSACQTATGDRRAALGLAGIAVRAGARSTVASLWSVDDAATATLMSQFYHELANTQLTKAEALRRAQQALLKNPRYTHPFYWAPYVLVGNWQ